MGGPLFVFGLTGVVCLWALANPSVGLIAYFGYAIWCPQFHWRWQLPEAGFQKYLALATLIGFLLRGFSGNKLTGAQFWACAGLTVHIAIATVSASGSIRATHCWEYLDIFSKIWLMTMVGCFLLDSPSRIIGMMWVIVIAQGFNAYEVNTEYFSLGYSITEIYGRNYLDNNTYALSTLAPMACAASLAIYSEKFWQKGLAAGILLLQLHQLMLLMSRGCFIGGALIFAIMFYWMPKRSDIMAGLAAAVVLGAAMAGPTVVEEFATIFADERDDSADSRFELWKAGTGIMLDNPLLGVGPDVGRYYVHQYCSIPNLDKALHNLFFDIGAGTGIISLAAYMLFFAAAWWPLWRLQSVAGKDLPPWAKCANLAVLASIPGYWVGSMFSSGALIESPYIVTTIGISVYCVLAREWQPQATEVEVEYVHDWPAHEPAPA